MSVTQLCFCDPMDYSLPDSSVHGISSGKNTGMDSHSHLQGIFLTQRWNLGLLHCRQILYYLSHQEFQGLRFFSKLTKGPWKRQLQRRKERRKEEIKEKKGRQWKKDRKKEFMENLGKEIKSFRRRKIAAWPQFSLQKHWTPGSQWNVYKINKGKGYEPKFTSILAVFYV